MFGYAVVYSLVICFQFSYVFLNYYFGFDLVSWWVWFGFGSFGWVLLLICFWIDLDGWVVVYCRLWCLLGFAFVVCLLWFAFMGVSLWI